MTLHAAGHCCLEGLLRGTMTRCDRFDPPPAAELIPMPPGLGRAGRRALSRLERAMRARREVEVLLAQAVAIGEGRGGAEAHVRTRVCGGESRADQLQELIGAHEAAMAGVLRAWDELVPVVVDLDGEDALSRKLREIAEAEVVHLGALVDRYADDQLWLQRLVRRWRTLAPRRQAA